MCRDYALDQEVDPWAGSTRVNRLALGLRPAAKQLDLFKKEPFSPWASHWVRVVARSVNAELPSRARETGGPLAPLPVEDLVAYVRKGRCPDPTDPVMLVPERVWALFLAAVSNPCARPNALREEELERLSDYLGDVASYAQYLMEHANTDPIAKQIGINTKALTYNNIQSWYVPLPPILRRELTQAVAYDLVRAARAELLMRLACPVTRMSSGKDKVVVQFAGLVEYVADAAQRKLYVQVLNEFDQWVVAEGTFDLYRPLATDFWLDTFVKHWLHRWAPAASFPVYAVLRGWLRSSLRREIGRARLRPMLRRALLEGFEFMSLIKPDVARLAMTALPRARKHALLSRDYNRTWGDWDALQRIARENPKLLHLYQLARQRGDLQQGAEIGDLKSLMEDWGTSRGGWNLLCQFGPDVYCSSTRAGNFGDGFELIAAQVKLFQQVDLNRVPPRCLQSALYIGVRSEYDNLELPPAFIRHAWAELDRHEADGTADFFLREEFMPVLRWVRAHTPKFDKNQLKAGWRFWSSAYTRWSDEQRDISEGRPWAHLVEIPNIEYGPYVAVPITSTAALIDEAEAMHHCVASYEDRCRSGEYVVFSIREQASWKRAATLGLYFDGSGWGIDQLSGYANKAVALAVRRVASAVTDQVNACCRSSKTDLLSRPCAISVDH